MDFLREFLCDMYDGGGNKFKSVEKYRVVKKGRNYEGFGEEYSVIVSPLGRGLETWEKKIKI